MVFCCCCCERRTHNNQTTYFINKITNIKSRRRWWNEDTHTAKTANKIEMDVYMADMAERRRWLGCQANVQRRGEQTTQSTERQSRRSAHKKGPRKMPGFSFHPVWPVGARVCLALYVHGLWESFCIGIWKVPIISNDIVYMVTYTQRVFAFG